MTRFIVGHSLKARARGISSAPASRAATSSTLSRLTAGDHSTISAPSTCAASCPTNVVTRRPRSSSRIGASCRVAAADEGAHFGEQHRETAHARARDPHDVHPPPGRATSRLPRTSSTTAAMASAARG